MGWLQAQRFIATTALEVRGLGNRYFRPAFPITRGEPCAGRSVGESGRIGAPRAFHQGAGDSIAASWGARASLASGRVRGRLEVYAADQASTVTVDGQAQPLEYDPTAALAYQLDKSPLYAMEIAAFLRAGVFARPIPRDRTQDGLFMLTHTAPVRSRWCWCTARCRAPCAGPSWSTR